MTELYESATRVSLTKRTRRLRKSPLLRTLVQETRLSVSDFMYPIFIDQRITRPQPITSMPGISRLSLSDLRNEIPDVVDAGIPAILIFGLPKAKDALASEAYAPDGIVQRAVRTIKKIAPDLVVATDVCLCEYMDHGHCGVVKGGRVDNDESLQLLAKVAVSHAEAGADVVGPSAMMDGQVKAIRSALDAAGYDETVIMAYSAKYASSFYGPFREAAESAPAWGDRRAYQMDFPNRREALREIALDIEEGADIVMVKPALSYLDIIRDARDRFDLPLAAYNVSGEYSMIKAAGEKGWLKADSIALEVLTAVKRAGASIIITYFAKEVAQLLKEA